jgi:membrane protein YdbS with pleckstrin-like domain
METPDLIELKPAGIFAFIKIFPIILCAIAFLLLSWRYFPGFIWLSFFSIVLAAYRFIYIRSIKYQISAEIIRITRGIFFKRIDQVELFRVKDYILTRSFLLQVFGLMDLELKSTDPVNPVIWLRGIPYSDLVDTIRAHVQETRQHNRIYEIN